ncbi:MAG: CvpA family protein [Clostridiales bacterium]|nr:CvpA family protein [Clostridiales bacterium]
MNWVLIIVLLIFLICIIHGWRKGFLRLLFSLLSFIILIGVISFATPYISRFLKNNTGIYAAIEERCAQTIGNRVGTGLEFITGPTAGVAADWILKGASFLVALVAALIVVRIISRILGLIGKIPVIRGINKFFGLIAGGVEAYIIVSLLFLFISVIAGTGIGSSVTENINESQFLSLLYYNNIILKLNLL